jgi:hypothetical protein
MAFHGIGVQKINIDFLNKFIFLGQALEKYPGRIYVFLDDAQKFPAFADVVKEYFDC